MKLPAILLLLLATLSASYKLPPACGSQNKAAYKIPAPNPHSPPIIQQPSPKKKLNGELPGWVKDGDEDNPSNRERLAALKFWGGLAGGESVGEVKKPWR